MAALIEWKSVSSPASSGLIWAWTKTYFSSLKEMENNSIVLQKEENYLKIAFSTHKDSVFWVYCPSPLIFVPSSHESIKCSLPCSSRTSKPVPFALQRKENSSYLLPVTLMLSTWTRTDRLWFLAEWPSCQPKSRSTGSSPPRKSRPTEQTLFMIWREALYTCNLILTTRGWSTARRRPGASHRSLSSINSSMRKVSAFPTRA